MIQINLIPDVKRELLVAKRQRAAVISGAILVSMVFGACVALMSVYAFGAQAALLGIGKSRVEKASAELLAVEDIDQSLTLQNQLRLIGQTHSNKAISSNLFATFTQLQVKGVSVSGVILSTEDGTITIKAESRDGYKAVEQFIKTLKATNLYYTDENNTKVTKPLTTEVTEGERSYGRDANNAPVVLFELSFKYDTVLFQRGIKQLSIKGPERTKATDSFEDIPKGLFKQPSISNNPGLGVGGGQ